MKKVKFLNGISLMFTFAVVALAATFASCEKENFNVNVKPADAQANVSAIVLYMDNDKTTDVTKEATVTISNYKEKGSPALEEQTVTITATYKNITGSVEVKIPALAAGQYANVTGTVILQAPETKYEVVTEEGETTTESEVRGETLQNPTEYNVVIGTEYTNKSGNKVVEKKINEDAIESANELAAINNLFNTLNDTYKEENVKVDVKVWAHAQKRPVVAYNVTRSTYNVYRRAVTKAEGDVELASAIVDAYQTTYYGNDDEKTPNEPIPGHGHQPIDHDHGHGNGNAGGGVGEID